MSHSIFTQQITEQLEQMILQYATMWMNLPNIKLSERNHIRAFTARLHLCKAQRKAQLNDVGTFGGGGVTEKGHSGGFWVPVYFLIRLLVK